MGIRESIGKWLLRPQLERLQRFLEAGSVESMLSEPGWEELGGQASPRDFTPAARKAILANSRYYWAHDPLAGQAVRLYRDYVLGSGLTWTARDPKVREVVEAFWSSPRNQGPFTRFEAQQKLIEQLAVEGELFLCLHVSKTSGRVVVRTIPPEEITEVITADGDDEWPLYYRRSWSEKAWDYSSHAWRTETRTKYYRDVSNADDGHDEMSDGGTERLVVHVALNTLGKRGVPIHSRAIPWIKAHKGFLEDRVTLTLALATFAFRQKVKGSRAAVDRLRALWEEENVVDRYAAGARGGLERAPGARTIVENEAVTLEQMRTDTGASSAYTDGRMLLHEVCAATGIFEHYFGNPECYSSDTEALTEMGFMRHDEWQEGMRVACYDPQTGKIEFQHPYGLRVFDYEGEMIHFQNAQTDILVTPNHRMWTAPHSQWRRLPAEGQKSGKGGRPRIADGGAEMLDRSWRFEEACTLAESPRTHGWALRAAATYDGERADEIDTPLGRIDAELWARFLGYWIAEGSTLAPRKRNGEERERIFYRVMLAQKDGPVLDKMRAVLRGLGCTYHESWAPSGVVTLTMVNKEIWTYLREVVGTGSHDKRIPAMVLGADQRVRRALFDALMEGDGGQCGACLRYSTASVGLADDMQRLALSLGYGATVTCEVRPYQGEDRPIWRVMIRRKWLETKILPRHVHREQYSGKVYCFHLPHHIYVTRRNGKIAIQGNTGNLATATAMELPMLKMFESWQRLVGGIYLTVLEVAVHKAIEYGDLPGEVETIEEGGVRYKAYTPGNVNDEEGTRHLDMAVGVDFPPIVQRDVPVYVGALVQAFTSGALGSTLADPRYREGTRLLLQALGVANIEEVISRAEEAIARQETETPSALLPQVEALRGVLEEVLRGHGA